MIYSWIKTRINGTIDVMMTAHNMVKINILKSSNARLSGFCFGKRVEYYPGTAQLFGMDLRIQGTYNMLIKEL